MPAIDDVLKQVGKPIISSPAQARKFIPWLSDAAAVFQMLNCTPWVILKFAIVLIGVADDLLPSTRTRACLHASWLCVNCGMVAVFNLHLRCPLGFIGRDRRIVRFQQGHDQ